MKHLFYLPLLISSMLAFSSCNDEDEDPILAEPTISLSENDLSGTPGDEVVITVRVSAEAGINLFTVNNVSIAAAVGQTSYLHTETYTIENSDDIVEFTYVVTDSELNTATETLRINQSEFSLPTITLEATEFSGNAGDEANITATVLAEAGIASFSINGVEYAAAIGQTEFAIDTTFILDNNDSTYSVVLDVVDAVEKTATATFTVTETKFDLPTITLNETEFSGNAGEELNIIATVSAEAGINSLTLNGVEYIAAIGQTEYVIDTTYVLQNTENEVVFNFEVVDEVNESTTATTTVQESTFALPYIELDVDNNLIALPGQVLTFNGKAIAAAGIKLLSINDSVIAEAQGATSYNFLISHTLENTDLDKRFEIDLVDNIDMFTALGLTIDQVAVDAPVVDLSTTSFTGFTGNAFTVDVDVTSDVDVTVLVNGTNVDLVNGSATIQDEVATTDETVEVVVTDEIGQITTVTYDINVRAKTGAENLLTLKEWNAISRFDLSEMRTIDITAENLTLEYADNLTLTVRQSGSVVMTANYTVNVRFDDAFGSDQSFVDLTNIQIVDQTVVNTNDYLLQESRRFNPNSTTIDLQLAVEGFGLLRLN